MITYCKYNVPTNLINWFPPILLFNDIKYCKRTYTGFNYYTINNSSFANITYCKITFNQFNRAI